MYVEVYWYTAAYIYLVYQTIQTKKQHSQVCRTNSGNLDDLEGIRWLRQMDANCKNFKMTI